MRTAQHLTVVQGAFTRLLYMVMTQTYGKTSYEVLAEGVKTLGVRGYMRYMAAATKVINTMQREFGEATAQFLIGLSSLYIGCGFCAYGHVLAGALVWFRDEKSFHPLHTGTIQQMFTMTDEELDQYLESLLSEPAHARLRQLALRLHQILLDQIEVSTPEDQLLDACRWVWYWTTECTIIEGVSMPPQQAFPIHPVGRDKQLRARYEKVKTRVLGQAATTG